MTEISSASAASALISWRNQKAVLDVPRGQFVAKIPGGRDGGLAVAQVERHAGHVPDDRTHNLLVAVRCDVPERMICALCATSASRPTQGTESAIGYVVA